MGIYDGKNGKWMDTQEIVALDRNSIPELNRDIEFIDTIRHLIMDKNQDEALKYLDDWKDELIMKADNTPLTHEEDE